MLLGTFTKQPGETLDYDIDFSRWLTSGDNVATAVAAVDILGELSVDLVTIADPRVKIWTSGGNDGATYKITCTMTTAEGRIRQDEFRIKVKEF